MSKGKFCVNCGVPSMLLCSRCNDSYCSTECQKTDWMRHRPICFKMPTLVPDLDSLELNMLTSLSTVNTGRQCSDSGLNLTIASPSLTLTKQDAAQQPLPSEQEPIKQSVIVEPAPLKQRSVFAEPNSSKSEKDNQTTDNEMKLKPINRTQSSLKTPIPTSVLKLQPASTRTKKAPEPKKEDPPKPLTISDVVLHKWSCSDKINVVALGANEKMFTFRENNAQVSEAYERITEAVKAYCKDKKGCGYKPEVGELVLAVFLDEWYRAEVVDVVGDSLFVRYIDFGNYAEVQEADIIPMPVHLNQFEVYAKDFIVDNYPETLDSKQEEILSSERFTITDFKADNEEFLHCKIFGF